MVQFSLITTTAINADCDPKCFSKRARAPQPGPRQFLIALLAPRTVQQTESPGTFCLALADLLMPFSCTPPTIPACPLQPSFWSRSFYSPTPPSVHVTASGLLLRPSEPPSQRSQSFHLYLSISFIHRDLPLTPPTPRLTIRFPTKTPPPRRSRNHNHCGNLL